MSLSDAGEATLDMIKKERLEARLTREQKVKLQRAAQLTGRSLSDFVIASAEAAAEALIREREVITLSAETSRMFAEVLLSPPEPTDKLRATISQYGKAVGEE